MGEEDFDVALWRETVREMYGGREDAEVARLTGVSQPWVNQIRNGRIPSRRTLAAIADTLKPARDMRSRLFRMAGYVDPLAALDEPPYDPDAAFMEGVRQLREEFGGDYQFSLGEFPFSEATPEEIEAALAAIRARLEERRR